MTPHILTRKTRLRPRNFLINDAKGLLQQYRVRSGSAEYAENYGGKDDALIYQCGDPVRSRGFTKDQGDVRHKYRYHDATPTIYSEIFRGRTAVSAAVCR